MTAESSASIGHQKYARVVLVRFGSKADIGALFDHLVGAREKLCMPGPWRGSLGAIEIDQVTGTSFVPFGYVVNRVSRNG